MITVTIAESVWHKSHTHILDGELVFIGRSTDNDVVLENNELASKRHAVIARVDQSYFLCDLSDVYATLVNGHVVQGRAVLQPNDVISIGQTQLIFEPEFVAVGSDAGLALASVQ